MLRRLLLTALIAGTLAGLTAAAVQQVKAVPLILQAEVYENAATDAPEGGGWEPAPGAERIAYRVVTDVIAGVGFAMILSGAFALYGLAGGRVDFRRGLLWGLGGYAVFSLAPALGLPPELPGMEAAALGARQAWWLGTVAATGGGLLLLVFGTRLPLRMAGVALLLLPHLIGAPHPAQEGGTVPPDLVSSFAAASLLSAASFWLVLGGVGGSVYRRLS